MKFVQVDENTIIELTSCTIRRHYDTNKISFLSGSNYKEIRFDNEELMETYWDKLQQNLF